jgi:hypothetical protein
LPSSSYFTSYLSSSTANSNNSSQSVPSSLLVDRSNYFPFPLSFFPAHIVNNNNSSQSVPSPSSSSFPPSTTDNNNSSQSFSSSVPTSFLKKEKRKRQERRKIDDRKFIPAKTGTNKKRNLAYKCLRCGHFLYFVNGRSYQCCICHTYCTLIVRGKTPYLAMSTKSSSKKYRLTNCECSECLSHDVYFIGKARYDTVRCICTNCGSSGLCRPSANPATNARLVRWDDLKQHSKSKSARKFVLDKLDDSTK